MEPTSEVRRHSVIWRTEDPETGSFAYVPPLFFRKVFRKTRLQVQSLVEIILYRSGVPEHSLQGWNGSHYSERRNVRLRGLSLYLLTRPPVIV